MSQSFFTLNVALVCKVSMSWQWQLRRDRPRLNCLQGLEITGQATILSGGGGWGWGDSLSTLNLSNIVFIDSIELFGNSSMFGPLVPSYGRDICPELPLDLGQDLGL